MGNSTERHSADRPGVLRRLARALYALGAGAVISLAVLLLLARLALPALTHYRGEVERWLSEAVGQPVAIGAIEAHWEGWTPQLRVRDVRLLGGGGGRPVARFSQARLSIDLPSSLRTLSFQPGRLVVVGASFSVIRESDGTLRIAGLGEDETTAAAGDGEFARWLLGRSRVRLEGATVIWHNRSGASGPIPLTSVVLQVRNAGNRHQISGTGVLPVQWGDRIAFAADLSGNPLSRDWAGTVFLHGDGIAIGRWPFQGRRPGPQLTGGSADFDLWSTWEDSVLQRVEGRVGLMALHVGEPPAALSVQSAKSRFTLTRNPHGWLLDLADLQLTTANGAWPATTALLRIEQGEDGEPARWVGEVGYLRLEDLRPLLGTGLLPPGRLRDAARGLQPRGTLQGLRFVLAPRDGGPGEYYVQASFRDLSTAPWASLPGVEGLAGRIVAAPGGGHVDLEGGRFGLRYPEFLPAPMAAEQARGRIEWRRSGGHWRVSTPALALRSDGLALRVAASARWSPEQSSPLVDVVMRLDAGAVEAIPRHLPLRGIPPPVRRWLRQALVGGRILGGAALFHGHPEDFPFEDGSGRFEAHVDFDGATLAYAPGWPELHSLQGTLSFSGRRMDMELREGGLLGASLPAARAVIEDMGAEDPLLTVTGRATGATATGLQFLRESPLAGRFGNLLGGLEVSGASALELSLGFRLKAGGDKTVAGTLRLEKNDLEAAGLGIALNDVSGTVHFTRSSISAEDLEARYLGRDVRLDVARSPLGRGYTRFSMRGRGDREFLQRQLERVGFRPGGGAAAWPLLARVQGQTDWSATLDVPEHAGEGGERPPARLRVASTLEGIALDLPAPFRKAAAASREFSVQTTLGEHAPRLVRLDYAPVHALLQVQREGPGAPGFERGILRLDDGPLALPVQRGLVIRGRTARLSLDAWADALAPPAAQPAAPAAGRGARAAPGGTRVRAATALAALRDVDVEVAEVRLLDYGFGTVHLRAAPDADGTWLAHMDGRRVQGTVSIPPRDTGQPVVIDLQRLAIAAPARRLATREIEPGALPPIRLSCKSLIYDSRPLGAVKMETVPEPSGLRVDPLELVSDGVTMHATGTWRVVKGEHRSSLEASVDSDDLAALLGVFGYDRGVAEGGATHLEVQGRWRGPPNRFSLERMNGSLSVQSTEGRLLEVSPGTTGRVFGLLSLGSLPRRLKGDFSDLFGGGLSYDRIEGTFDIENGDAYTNDLTLEGPSARIEVSGRVGLADRDYDEVMTVTPRLASTLPLAGAVLGPAGVGVGAAVWLAEKLFDTELVNRVAARRYTVTGDWSDPTVRPLEPPTTPTDGRALER